METMLRCEGPGFNTFSPDGGTVQGPQALRALMTQSQKGLPQPPTDGVFTCCRYRVPNDTHNDLMAIVSGNEVLGVTMWGCAQDICFGGKGRDVLVSIVYRIRIEWGAL